MQQSLGHPHPAWSLNMAGSFTLSAIAMSEPKQPRQ